MCILRLSPTADADSRALARPFWSAELSPSRVSRSDDHHESGREPLTRHAHQQHAHKQHIRSKQRQSCGWRAKRGEEQRKRRESPLRLCALLLTTIRDLLTSHIPPCRHSVYIVKTAQVKSPKKKRRENKTGTKKKRGREGKKKSEPD